MIVMTTMMVIILRISMMRRSIMHDNADELRMIKMRVTMRIG